MASRDNTPPKPSTPQSIPLQDLSRHDIDNDPVTHFGAEFTNTDGIRSSRHERSISILNRSSRGPIYTRLEESPTRTYAQTSYGGSGMDPDNLSLADSQAFASAATGIDLDFSPEPARFNTPFGRTRNPAIITTPAEGDNADSESLFSPPDNDTTPLTNARWSDAGLSTPTTTGGQRHDRLKGRGSVHFFDGVSPQHIRGRSSRLGDDLPSLDTGPGLSHRISTVGGGARGRLSSSSPGHSDRSRSLSPSPSPMARANTIFREISQRVVNLSNDTDMVDQSLRRKSTVRHTRRPSTLPRDEEAQEGIRKSPRASISIETPAEKTPDVDDIPPSLPVPRVVYQNPLRGNSWGIFSPENRLRKALCEVLIHPLTEPIILVLIILQAVLLAVNAATDAIYHETRSKAWGSSKIDYAILALFVVYTLEVIARSIVSGFIRNPYEYSTFDHSVGMKTALMARSRSLFAPPKEPVSKPATAETFQPSIVRTFTGMPDINGPGHSKQQQRIRLARRAFLRHSFNRLDMVAVVSYWISFGMQLSGYEAQQHVYVFNMMSCLRILRLLGLTTGTSIILRSLKRAAPLLVHVAFLISFFWLIFGIVGVQSFKSSLRRTCVWIGDDGSGQNYTQNVAPENIQFCGGFLDVTTGAALPWLQGDGQNGTSGPKGFLCPQGSLCVEGPQGPYNGTVSFDNILQSLELVFVIISSNTFSDLLYYLTDSDYLVAALFFAFGIVVLSMWLMNLLVVVITSSFQVIREESRQSAFTAETIEQAPLDDEEQTERQNNLKRIFDKTHPFWILVIVFDIVVQCLRSASMGPAREKFILNTETVVTLLLLVEIILRIITDWRHFFFAKHNWFDLFLAIITSVSQIPSIRNSGQAYAWLSAFQIVRIYRVVLAFRFTRDLVMIVFRNAVGLLNLILFVFLFTFLAAILASQLFRGDFPDSDAAGSTVYVQFFDIWNSFIGMYQILSSENWTTIMYNATQFDLMWQTSWLGATFCIMWYIIANFIILNMFIAVIQESFDVSEDEKRLHQVKAFLRQKELSGSSSGNLALSSIFRFGRSSERQREALEYGSAAMEQLLKDAVVKDFLDEQEEQPKIRPTSTHFAQTPTTGVNDSFLSKLWAKITGATNANNDPNPFYSHAIISRANEDFDPRTVAKQVVETAENRRRLQRQYLARHPHYNVSLYIFKPNSYLRRLCQYVVGPGRGEERVEGVAPYKPAWYAFSAFTYAAIVAMVVLACITTPLYQREYYQTHDSSTLNWFAWTDVGFAVLFTIEAFIKIVADGFFFTPHAYLRSVWGFIDGIVLLTLWINVSTVMLRDDGISRAVGAFKALRALRLLNISDSARDTFHSVIIVGIYKILAAAFVSLSLLIPFAILGLNLFNGKMESCNDGDFGFSGLTNCVGEYNSTPFNWPVLAPRQVSNPYYSFDDFGSALFILFQIVSQEGWIDVLWSATSITGRGLQPQPFASQGNAVYFIIFNLLGSVFVLTLFISVFMRNYTEQTGVAFLTAEQRSWLELRKLLKQVSPSKRSLNANSSAFRKWCYDKSIKKRGVWQRFITGLLICHLMLLVVEFYPEPEWWSRLREYIFVIFTVILMVNVVIRIIGLSWKRYRHSAWDLFSTVAVFGTFLTSLMILIKPENRTFDQLHKLFLVSITFLLIPRNNQLDHLFKTAAASLPLILNLLATWAVLFLVFAIAFTQIFGLTRFGSNESGNLNFRDVPRALILLFRTSIGEGWNAIMEDFATIEPPFCVRESNFLNSDCGDSSWARFLFIAWNIISMYIFVSLFVSLIFESFSYVYQRSGGLEIVTRDEIRRFKQAWADFDPRGTGYISKSAFPRLLGELSGVFQMRIYDGDFTVKRIIEDCSVQPGDPKRAAGRVVDGIDLDKLSERLQHIPVDEIRRRRERMNVFYHEILLSADPDRGVSFTSCLMILAHYNVINDNRSLRLEEFLRRRARLQRVHESIRRDVVIGFFDMMYAGRRFRQGLEHRRNSRLVAPPHLPVPEILIENPEDSMESSSGTTPHDFLDVPLRSPKRPSPRLPPLDTSFRLSTDSARGLGSPSVEVSPRASPTLSPRRLHSIDISYAGFGRSPPTSPIHSRQPSTTSDAGAQGVMESFDNSAWGESIRRSFTTHRPK